MTTNKDLDEIKLSAFELSCIVLVMQKVDSEKWHKGRNGLYLDSHEKKVLKRLVKLQEKNRLNHNLRLIVK